MSDTDKILNENNYRSIYTRIFTQHNSPMTIKTESQIINNTSNASDLKKKKKITNKLKVNTNISTENKESEIYERTDYNPSQKNIKQKHTKIYNYTPLDAETKESLNLLKKLQNIQHQTSLIKDELKKYKKFKKLIVNQSSKNINSDKYKTIKNVDTKKKKSYKKRVIKLKDPETNINEMNDSGLITNRNVKKTPFNSEQQSEKKKIITELINEMLVEKNINTIEYFNNEVSRFLKFKNNELKKIWKKKTKNEIHNKSAENRKKLNLSKNFDLTHKHTAHLTRHFKSKSRSKSKNGQSFNINIKNRNISPIRKAKNREIIGKCYQNQFNTKNVFHFQKKEKNSSRITTTTNTQTNLSLKKNKEKNPKKKGIKTCKSMEKVNNDKLMKQLPSQTKSQPDISLESLSKNLKNENKKKKKEKEILQIEKLCKKGFLGPGVEKQNQDNFFIYSNFNNNPNNIYMGVCDGHGDFGKEISSFLVTNLPLVLGNFLRIFNIKDISSSDNATLLPIVKNSFKQINKNILLEKQIDSTLSGSTCVSLIYTPKKVFCINLGDSRCIVGRFDGQNWSSKDLSVDHKPDIEIEKERIIQNGGIVRPSKDEDGDFIGPQRVWRQDAEMPGLAMSRSFGDQIAHQIGVICDPEMVEYELNEEDKFLILASDGIWQFISSQECVDIVKDYYINESYKGALKHLYQESCQRWIDEEESIDDMTLIIVFFK